MKVLLIDTNISSHPIFEYLECLGLDVYVCGGNPNDFLAKKSKNYIEIDYSDVQKMKELISAYKFDFIVPGCNDLSYQTCTLLNINNEFFGLDSVENSDIINKKDLFRKLAIDLKIPVPRVINYDDALIKENVIVKPVDAYSGRGVTILNNPNSEILNQAVKKALSFSKTERYIIEEYVKGQLYSHSAYLVNGVVVLDFIVEEYCTANPFAVDTSRLVYNFDTIILNYLRQDIEKIAQKLNLKDGLVHTQFIFDNISYWIIEVTRRCPGDLYSQLIELSTGYKYAENYVRPFLDKKITFHNIDLSKNKIIRHTVSQTEDCHLTYLAFNFNIKIERYIPLRLAGDKIKAAPIDRVALIFIKCESDTESDLIFEETINRKLYSVN